MLQGNSVNIISVDQFRALAPEVDLTSYSGTTTISGMISAASSAVGNYLGYNPVAEDITDELAVGRVTTDGNLVIFPQKIPIISVSSMSLQNGATSLAIALTNSTGTNKYNIPYHKRSLSYPTYEITLQGTPIFTDFYSLRGRSFYTKLSYRGGFEAYAIPADIQLAVALYVKDLISQTSSSGGATRISQGGISLDFGAPEKTGKSSLILQAERLLNPYRSIN